MLIKDTKQLVKDSFYNEVGQDNFRIRQALNQYRDSVLIGKNDDPTDIVKRMGESLTAPDLIRKIYKLSKDILIERNPFKPFMYVVYDNRGAGKKYLCAFEDGIVPERTVMDTKIVEDIDPDTLDPAWTPKRIDANDSTEFNTSKPGLKTYEIPNHIIKMGYRTILLRILLCGLATLPEIEKEFNSDNTPEWAAKTGKRTDVVGRF